MRKILSAVFGILLLASMSWGQQHSISFDPSPVPDKPGHLTLQLFGTTGTSTCTYYVSAVYPQGETAPAGPVATSQCNGTLSSTNFVRILWRANPGAVAYNVLKTATTPATGSILLGTTTSNPFLDDTGQALSSWTKPAFYPPATLTVEGFKGGIRLPVQDFCGQTCNVRAFGAVGDDVHDDTLNIQAAINRAQDKGGTVTIPPGTYKITSGLTVDKPTTIICTAGRVTVIDASSLGGVAAITFQYGTQDAGGTGPGIKGCTLLGPGKTTAGSIGIALGSGSTSATGEAVRLAHWFRMFK